MIIASVLGAHSLSERRDVPGLDGTVLAVVEDELEDDENHDVSKFVKMASASKSLKYGLGRS
jgi:hypothetical protein